MPIPAENGALVEAADLAALPGAPFPDEVVAAVSEEIRSEAGWHIAPARTETVYVDSPGGQSLLLPTLRLNTVAEVRDVTTDALGSLVTGYRVAPTESFRGGVLEHPGGWPRGVLKVTINHGYDSIPADLLPVAAGMARDARVDQVTNSVRLGSLSITPSTAEANPAAVDRYRIPAGL